MRRELGRIPGAKTKNGVEHIVPLSDQAIAVISKQRRHGPFVFSANGRTAVDMSIEGGILKKLVGFNDWRLHDLRRSVASGMQRLGVKPEVIDKCLNHSAVVKGVAAVYLREQYLPERRTAYDLWGAHIAKLATP